MVRVAIVAALVAALPGALSARPLPCPYPEVCEKLPYRPFLVLKYYEPAQAWCCDHHPAQPPPRATVTKTGSTITRTVIGATTTANDQTVTVTASTVTVTGTTVTVTPATITTTDATETVFISTTTTTTTAVETGVVVTAPVPRGVEPRNRPSCRKGDDLCSFYVHLVAAEASFAKTICSCIEPPPGAVRIYLILCSDDARLNPAL
jgi:hypothetical protein